MFDVRCQKIVKRTERHIFHSSERRPQMSRLVQTKTQKQKIFIFLAEKNVAPFLKTPEYKCYNLFVRSWIICSRTDCNWTCGAASDDHCLHHYKYITINKMIIIVILLIISKVTSAKYQNVNIFCLYIYESNKRKNLSHSRYLCSKWLKRFLKLLIFCPSTNGWLD